VSINNLPGSPTLPPPGARQTLIEPFFSLQKNCFNRQYAGDPATSPLQQSAEQDNRNFARGKAGNESGELAFCNETRQEQIQNQRKRTKKISAAAEQAKSK